MCNGLKVFVEQTCTDYVYWIDISPKIRYIRVSLHAVPIDVAKILKEQVFDKTSPVILTSATLSVNRSFNYIKERVGLSNCSEVILGSSFDYKKQALLFIPDDLPDPSYELKQFQDLGHHIQLVIGDDTAIIGDPSGRSETRPMLSREEIEKNMETYQRQVFKILDPDKTELLYNSEWLGSFSGTNLINLCSKYSVQQLLQRRDFNSRIKQNRPLSITELLYPLLVGYDSVYLGSDIEIGGTDQLFNLVISREIQKAYGQEPEVIITLPILEGIDGIKKMSKSLGNAIGVDDDSNDMYGKIMSISDDLMLEYYKLLSQISVDELERIKKNVRDGKVNPMEYKQRLAREIVSRYHGQDAAVSAEEMFNRVHRMKKVPENLEEQIIKYPTNEKGLSIICLLYTSPSPRDLSTSRMPSSA